MKANQNHVKLLTSKLFFQILSESLHWRRKDAFLELTSTLQDFKKMEEKMHRFSRVMAYYGTEMRRFYLRKWYRRAMNYVHENYKKLALIDYNVSKKRKMFFYFKWRQAFLHNRKNYELKIESCKLLRTFIEARSNLSCRHYMCKWRDFVELRQFQQDAFSQIMTRKRMRTQRRAFVRWLAIHKQKDLEERYDKMTELVTNMWYK